MDDRCLRRLDVELSLVKDVKAHEVRLDRVRPDAKSASYVRYATAMQK